MNDFQRELARRNPDWEKIVAVHNAALAVERETYVNQREDWIKEIQQLQQQLAAEREKVKALVELIEELEAEFGLTEDQRKKYQKVSTG